VIVRQSCDTVHAHVEPGGRTSVGHENLYGEFMVEESSSPTLGDKDGNREWGWEDWYVLREEHVLSVMLSGRSGGGGGSGGSGGGNLAE